MSEWVYPGDYRDLSLDQVARVTGHADAVLKAAWSSIPGAYVTDGGARWWAPRGGVRDWMLSRRNAGK